MGMLFASARLADSQIRKRKFFVFSSFTRSGSSMFFLWYWWHNRTILAQRGKKVN